MLSSGHLHCTPKVTWESHSEDRVCIVELSSISTTCGLYYNHLRPITPSIHNWGLSFFEIPTYVKGPSPFLLNPVYKGLYVFHSMYLSPIAQKTSSRVHIQTDELSVIVGSLVVRTGVEPVEPNHCSYGIRPQLFTSQD